jgi:replicative DNA helicase
VSSKHHTPGGPTDQPTTEAKDLLGATIAEQIPSLLEAEKVSQNGTRCGFEKLERGLFPLGLPDGLLVLGAEPGAGKTTFAMQLSYQVAQADEKRGVLFISYEQDVRTLQRRNFARETGIPLSTFARGAGELEDKQKQAMEKAQRSMWIVRAGFDCTAKKIEELAQEARRLTKTESCDRAPFIVIDYLQRMPPSSLSGDRRQQTIETVSRLQDLAGKLETPILLISSIARDSYKVSGKPTAQPSLSDFKESGEIEYCAEVAMRLVKGISGGSHVLHVLKNKNGADGITCFSFEPNIARFDEV